MCEHARARCILLFRAWHLKDICSFLLHSVLLPPVLPVLEESQQDSLSGSLLFASMSASRLVAYSVERREMQIGDSAISTFSPVGSLSSNGLRVCVFAFSVYSTGIARS